MAKLKSHKSYQWTHPKQPKRFTAPLLGRRGHAQLPGHIPVSWPKSNPLFVVNKFETLCYQRHFFPPLRSASPFLPTSRQLFSPVKSDISAQLDGQKRRRLTGGLS